MNDPVIKSIKDKWLDCEKLSEKDEALLFARIEKLEDELAAQQSVQRTCAKSPSGEHRFEPGQSLIICLYCGANR